MGGAVGHLQHLYDDYSLTFNEIKNILISASEGKLQKASEKLDGLNLVFSWDVHTDSLKVARSSGDIKRGGLSSYELVSKFSDRKNVLESFSSAFCVLSELLKPLPKKNKVTIFGSKCLRWYSIEIIDKKTQNVINYDNNCIVLHSWPIFKVLKPGDVKMDSNCDSFVELLTKYINKNQSATFLNDWKIYGPTSVKIKKLSNKKFLENTIEKITSIILKNGLNLSSTIEDYIKHKTYEDVKKLGFESEISKMVFDRCTSNPCSVTLVDIKKNVNKSDYETIKDFVKKYPDTAKEYIRPIELAINDFAIELLKETKSSFINDQNKEIDRLKAELAKAVIAIESSNNQFAKSFLIRQMEKLKSLEMITTSVEGVVFIYKNNAYKFTGSFAPAAQVLGLFKYGRSGTKLTIPY